MRISDWSSDVCSSDLSATTEEGRSLQSSIAQVQDLSTNWSNTLQTQFGMTKAEADKLARDTILTGSAGIAASGSASAKRGPFAGQLDGKVGIDGRSDEHTSELQSLMRISYAVFCLKKKKIEQ